MGVTNLTKDQPDHVQRIAHFALDALKAAQSTFIDEENYNLGRLNLRVGFHSGPVVANVVGSRNPRYCKWFWAELGHAGMIGRTNF